MKTAYPDRSRVALCKRGQKECLARCAERGVQVRVDLRGHMTRGARGVFRGRTELAWRDGQLPLAWAARVGEAVTSTTVV